MRKLSILALLLLAGTAGCSFPQVHRVRYEVYDRPAMATVFVPAHVTYYIVTPSPHANGGYRQSQTAYYPVNQPGFSSSSNVLTPQQLGTRLDRIDGRLQRIEEALRPDIDVPGGSEVHEQRRRPSPVPLAVCRLPNGSLVWASAAQCR